MQGNNKRIQIRSDKTQVPFTWAKSSNFKIFLILFPLLILYQFLQNLEETYFMLALFLS